MLAISVAVPHPHLQQRKVARDKILPVSILALKWAAKRKEWRPRYRVVSYDVKSGVHHRCSAHVLRHSGDLPRSVQRRRQRPSKQVWRWKKHVITWLLFSSHSWGYSFTLGEFSHSIQITNYADTVTRLSTPILGILFRVSCKSTQCTTMCGRKNESLTLWQQKSNLPSTFPSPLFPKASSKRKRVHSDATTQSTIKLSLLRFCSHSWVKSSERRSERHRYCKCRLNGRSDVPGARSTSPAGQSSPFPRPHPPPAGCLAALGSSPFAPPHRERKGDPSVKKVVRIRTLKNVNFFRDSY